MSNTPTSIHPLGAVADELRRAAYGTEYTPAVRDLMSRAAEAIRQSMGGEKA